MASSCIGQCYWVLVHTQWLMISLSLTKLCKPFWCMLQSWQLHTHISELLLIHKDFISSFAGSCGLLFAKLSRVLVRTNITSILQMSLFSHASADWFCQCVACKKHFPMKNILCDHSNTCVFLAFTYYIVLFSSPVNSVVLHYNMWFQNVIIL